MEDGKLVGWPADRGSGEDNNRDKPGLSAQLFPVLFSFGNGHTYSPTAGRGMPVPVMAAQRPEESGEVNSGTRYFSAQQGAFNRGSAPVRE